MVTKTAEIRAVIKAISLGNYITVEPRWLEHLWDRGNLFEIWVVQATEG